MLTRQERAQRVAEKLGLKSIARRWFVLEGSAPPYYIPGRIVNHLLDLEEEAAKKELQVQDLLNRLEFERNSTNCDKLFRERQTKRHWQERAEKAEAALLALRSELEEKKS